MQWNDVLAAIVPTICGVGAPALQALLRGSLRKAFNGFDLLCLGLGIVIGTGWGLLSGIAAETFAG